MDLAEIVRAFIKKRSRYSKYSKSTITNLFGVSETPKEYAFLALVGQKSYPDNQQNDLEKNISYTIRESIKSYSHSKETAVTLYRRFIDFLREDYNLNIMVEFPPIAVWISLERQMYIAKLLQDSNFNTSELANILLVSERTIEDDLAKLRGRDGDPLQVMGQQLIIDFDRDRNGIRFPSTVHPLFLTLNLTQVIAVLQGLEYQSRIPGYEKYAYFTAENIWNQLSDYAKNHIFSLTGTLKLNTEWLNRIDYAREVNDIRRLFSSERQCSVNEGCGNILMCLKNNKPCYLEYYEENGTTNIYHEVLPIKRDSHRVFCKAGGTEYWFDLFRILRSALRIEELKDEAGFQ